MESPELTLAEYWRIIRKRRMTIVTVFGLVMGATFIFTKMQTPVYEANLELKIEKNRPNFSVTPSDQQVTNFDLSQGPENLATDIRLIKSLPVMRKVVEKMEVLPSDPVEREQRIHSLSLAYQNRVTIKQIENTNILSIRVRANDPEKAALMATAIADVYIVENVESRQKQTVALIDYVEQQLEQYKMQLTQQEQRLQKFNQNEKVFEVTPDVKETLNRLTIEGTFEFEKEMLAMDSEIRRVENMLNQQELSEPVAMVLNEGLAENYIFTGLKRRLLGLEFERFLLLIDYTEKHPEVREQDAVIAGVKNNIVDMIKNFSKQKFTPEIEAQLALALKELFLETRREVLFRIVNKFYEDSGSLSSNQVEYIGLKRNVDRLINSYNTLLKQRDEGKLKLAQVVDDVIVVVSPATPNLKPVEPKADLNYLVSAAAGLLFGILMCFLKESMDSSVSTMADVENDLGLSILGLVPHMGKDDIQMLEDEGLGESDKKLMMQRARLITIMNPKSWPAESIKMLRTSISHLLKAHNHKTVLFTSSDKQEGKSTVVVNIALSMAQLGQKTLLIGSNLRRPTVYKTLGLDREPGLSDILMGHVPWREAINSSVDILTGGLPVDNLLGIPGIDNLKVITCGHPVENVSELLNSKAYDKLLADVKSYFDVIIIDCSPVMAVPDAITLSDKVDGVVLVYKVGETPKNVLRMAKANLVNANANILGIVLNDIKTDAQVGHSAYYYRYYSEAADERGGLVKNWKGKIAKSPKGNDKTFQT